MPTQAERALFYDNYVRILMGLPHVVGYHWFRRRDQPKGGRLDGENSNYGIVTIADEPYEVFGRVVPVTNGSAEALRVSRQ